MAKVVKEDTLRVGDKVYHPDYGTGRVKQVDPASRDFHYDFHFNDGTLKWADERFAKQCRLLHRPASRTP